MRRWAVQLASAAPEVQCVGYFGSYARGNWGVGSDLDLLLIVGEAEAPAEYRATGFDTTTLPVPVDLLVYTAEEWSSPAPGSLPFVDSLRSEVIWVVDTRP